VGGFPKVAEVGLPWAVGQTKVPFKGKSNWKGHARSREGPEETQKMGQRFRVPSSTARGRGAVEMLKVKEFWGNSKVLCPMVPEREPRQKEEEIKSAVGL